MSDPVSRVVEIVNVRGLHARASAALAREAAKYDAKVTICHEDHCADAASIMDLMMLVASKGCSVEVSAEGGDAEQAAENIADLIANRFGEDE
ncbi:MAG: HPr family phosphocarrier protein [Pseudomonadota bacterium]